MTNRLLERALDHETARLARDTRAADRKPLKIEKQVIRTLSGAELDRVGEGCSWTGRSYAPW